MSASLRPHAIFAQPCHLLSALHLVNPNALFPFEVLKTNHNQISVPLQLVGGSNFDHLRQQHGWQATVEPTPPKGEMMSLYRILQMTACWRPHDWEKTMTIAAEDRLATYLLGARDTEHAQQLVDILTDLLAPDIGATPWLLEATNGSQNSPFKFFWLAHMARPLLLPLQAAQGAWREIDTGSRVRLFVDWSYDLAVARQYLAKIDWGSSDAIVLLSHPTANTPPTQNAAPEVLMFRQPADGPSFADLITVANLQVGAPHILELQPEQTPRSPLQFNIQVRFAVGNPASALAERISRLKDEIQAKSIMLQQLSHRLPDSNYNHVLPQEPLHLYLDEREMPFMLQRLLVEWTDQTEDLRALQYQHLTTEEWPESVRPYYDAKNVHIVTTSLALGQPGPLDLGVRLCEYHPHGEHVSFALLPEWAHFGLRLFAPSDRHLHLYPEFQPSEIAANKLAQAVLGQATDGRVRSRQEWAALLIPTQYDQISPVLLRLQHFQPLCDSFQWNCSFDFTALAEPTTGQIKKQRQQAIQQQVAQITKDFRSSVWKEAKVQLNQQEQAIQTDLRRIEQEIAARREQIAAQQQTIQQLAPPIQELAQRLTMLSNVNNQLLHYLSHLNQASQQAIGKLDEVSLLKTELETQRHELKSLIQAIGNGSEKDRVVSNSQRPDSQK